MAGDMRGSIHRGTRPKLQTPNSKLQRHAKRQSLEFGIWSAFEFWSLKFGICRLGRRGEPDAECRASPLTAAFRGDDAAVQLDEVADDGEAEAKAGVGACRGRVPLREPIEHVRQNLRRDALPG